MINSQAKLKGSIDAVLTRGDGTVEKQAIENLVVDVGRALMASRLGADTIGKITYIGAGSSTSAPTNGNTNLTTPINRYPVTFTTATTTSTDDTAVFVANIVNVNGVVAETGLFNAATGGVMLSKANIGPFTMAPTDSLTLTWKVQVE